MSNIDDKDRKVKKTEAEWRGQLDPMQFEFARHAATERPFTGKYWNDWAEGDYRCVGCGRLSCSEAINSEVVECVVDETHDKARNRPASASASTPPR